MPKRDLNITFNNSNEFEVFLKDTFNIDLNNYRPFQNKINQIMDIIHETSLDFDSDPYAFFK